MKNKGLLIASLIVIFVVIGLVFYFNYSIAQTETAPAKPTTSSSETCSETCCYKQVMDRLDTVLANQAELFSRLDDLKQLVKTRKVD